MNKNELLAWLSGFESSFDFDDDGNIFPNAFQYAQLRKKIELMAYNQNESNVRSYEVPRTSSVPSFETCTSTLSGIPILNSKLKLG